MTIAEPTDAGAGDQRYLNRELSWLDFNQRVLDLARQADLPVLERAKFCAIFSSNLDEFFQVRVAGLKDQVAAGVPGTTFDGQTALGQLAAIRTTVVQHLTELDTVFAAVSESLSDSGVSLIDWSDLDEDDEKFLQGEFHDRIFPILTPLAVDLGHPFPYISNLSLSLGVVLRDPETQQGRFARLKVPDIIGRFIALPDEQRFIPAEQVIAAHLDQLFPGMEIVDKAVFRITRNGDLAVDEGIDDGEADDLLSAVELELRRRRFRSVVRLEIASAASTELRELLTEELDIDETDVYEVDSHLDLTALWQLHGLDRPDLKDPPFRSVTPAPLRPPEPGEDVDFFAVLRRKDVLVHHPYDSFTSTVQEFIRHAADDPHVEAIKLTIYRTSGDSPIVDALIRAAESGKQVAVVVELKARFDEAANIEWARRLERVGVHVAYGLVGLKVHSKTCLVVRHEPDGLRRYAHVGTGNYNSKTARIYSDFGLLTADESVGRDLSQLFNSLTGYGRFTDYERLVIAPHGLRSRLDELIAGETALGPDGHITLKMNSLVDPDIIDALYRASDAGTPVELIVRGICCLRPGIPGLSDNITVRSIVGKYLEHTRIYRFSNGGGAGVPVHLIGSADLMPRNLDRRIETMVHVTDEAHIAELDEFLETNLTDDVLAWELEADGTWRRVEHVVGIDTHRRLEELAGDH